MKQIIAKLIVAVLLVAPVVAVPTMAHAGEDHRVAVTGEDETTTTTNPKTRLTEEQKAAIRAEAKNRVEGRLAEAKKAVCEKRVEVITKIMTNAATAGARHLAVFDKILNRVKDFYTEKGLTVANYDALLAATDSKKTAAQAAIDAVKANTSFDCDAENPVGNIDAFNGKVRAMHTALKEYRTAIKDVIVAVKQAAEDTEEEGQ